MYEVDRKFGLDYEQSFIGPSTGKETAAQALQNKEDRREDLRLNKMAKQAQKFLS